jgi:hypothetical protein
VPERLTDVFYDLTVKAKKPHHFIKLNSEVKEDMKVWLSFLESFNGKAYFPESEWSDNEILELYTVRVQRLWGFGIFLKRVGVFSVATELGRLRHFKGYYFP